MREWSWDRNPHLIQSDQISSVEEHSMFKENRNTLVAQWIEHLTSNQEVAGSSPARGKYFYFYKCLCGAMVSVSVF